MPYRIDMQGEVFDVFENARASNQAYQADIWLGHWSPTGDFIADAICWSAPDGAPKSRKK